MTRGAPPLRFLALIVGGWIGFRLVALLAPWPGRVPPLAERQPTRIAAAAPVPAPIPPSSRREALAPPEPRTVRATAWPRPPSREARRASPVQAIAMPMRRAAIEAPALAPPRSLPAGTMLDLSAVAFPAPPPHAPSVSRWSASAWLLARRGRAAALAPGGTLGGDQAGARLLYRVNDSAARPLALAARLYLPLRATRGAEIAAGIDWQPFGLPLHLLAERRQAIGRDGRSAFSATIHGGRGVALPRGFRLDAYAQAGLVGARRRDLFVDGAARLATPLGPVELGGGLWGAAQPGAARLDAGPSASLRVPIPGIAARLQADWRFRLAGGAAPGSGPALTLAGDF